MKNCITKILKNYLLIFKLGMKKNNKLIIKKVKQKILLMIKKQ